MKRIVKWIQSDSKKVCPRGNVEEYLGNIKEAIVDGNVPLIYEFMNDKALLHRVVNGDPRVFYEILLSSFSVHRYMLFPLGNVNKIYDHLIIQLMKAAKKVHFGLFDGNTLLMSALENRMSYDIIDELINVGSDINAASSNTVMTPLMYALKAKNSKDIVIELINRGANGNSRDHEGCTPLFYGMRYYYRYSDVIELLLNAGSNVHDLDHEGKNVLMVGSCHCLDGSDCEAKESIDVLLKYGIGDIDLRHIDNKGNTILHKTFCKYIFELAVKSGVSIEAKNNRGRTPLLVELVAYYRWRLKCLLKLGANIHATDTQLNTAIHLCNLNYGGRLAYAYTVDMLIYHGVDMYARNGNNQTALDIIIERGFYEEFACVIPKHIILFDDNEFDFEKGVLQRLYHRANVSSYIVACKKELNSMKETFIADGVTFYEFCILKRYYKSKGVNISLNKYKYSCSEIHQMFPLYYNIIIIRFRDNRVKTRDLNLRKQFEKISLSTVHTMETDFNEVLNYDCLYKISRYLNYKDMFNVFSAAIDS